jgi:hypothetical protein
MVRDIHTQKTNQNQTLQTEARWLPGVKDHSLHHHQVENSAIPVSAFSGREGFLFESPKRIAVAVQWEPRNRPNSRGDKPSAHSGAGPGTELINEHHWLFAFHIVLILHPSNLFSCLDPYACAGAVWRFLIIFQS